jgi:RNA polymerase sigma-70 factor (ECF subfamily)
VAKNENNANRTRATLLGRLKNFDDHASWQEFFDIYWPLVYGFARKAGLTDAEAQDAVAETFAVVAKKMPGFKYDPAPRHVQGVVAHPDALAHRRPVPQTRAARDPFAAGRHRAHRND